MRKALLPLLLLLTAAASPQERAQWHAEAERVAITRDDWGIAHVEGRTDADAVFGMIYAQAEDDFRRIEANYLTALGRTAEAEGEKAIWQDLRARLYVSENELKAHYLASPAWLKRLMEAWAAGLNFYLDNHPQAKPRIITRFEPWMALSFTEGSIGGDIEQIKLDELQNFYSANRHAELVSASIPEISTGVGKWTLKQVQGDASDRERQGSNGIAIAPALTQAGRPLLLINPHTSWYFRSEQQVTSGEGLNVYGAATWGQFFIYQGFNANAGWMNTSSGVDSIDQFALDVRGQGAKRAYRYGKTWRPLGKRPVTIRYRKPDGSLGERHFTTWRTHRGPIIRAENGHWIAFAMMDRPVQALEQSFLRTKAKDLQEFLAVARLQANSSNDTIFADRSGAIAYLHPQFVPRRDDRFDYTKVVDGSDPRTDWGSLHQITELPNVFNPPNGWIFNTNNWPYSVAGPFSPKPGSYPHYMDHDGENFRGLHSLQLLTGSKGWTPDKLQAAAFDSYQPGFAALIPTLIAAFDALPSGDPRRGPLAGPIEALRGWGFRWSADSVPQSLAMAWGLALKKAIGAPASEPTNRVMMRLARDTSAEQKLKVLEEAIAELSRDFGRWQVPWGEVNRFQRISQAIHPNYDDAAPSLPVPFAEANFGSLASTRALPRAGTKKWYGDYGNSFIAIVEFGPRVRARAVSAGGESGDPKSPHFNDQAGRYAAGALRPVYFYADELKGHVERTYHPGD